MKIHHQGWNETVGAFNADVIFNEGICDYEIHLPDGTVFHQRDPFESQIADWDQTGKPYSKFGAFFVQNGLEEFFTPLELASLVLNGYAVIPGLQIENHQTSLTHRIQAATNRAKALTDTQNQTLPTPIR